MKKLKFKSNINCTSCLSKVQPALDKEDKIKSWEVDLESDDRILTIKTEEMSAEDVKKAIAKVGFVAEEIMA
jgi:copper chaperone